MGGINLIPPRPLSEHVPKVNLPRIAGGIRLGILGSGFLYVTRPAKRLQVCRVILGTATMQRLDMVALKLTGPPALPASPAVAPEDAQAEQLPAPPVELRVVSGAGHVA